MKTLILLDLEDTVIRALNPVPYFISKGIQQARALIQHHPLCTVGIFSFALHSEKELAEFGEFRAELEERIACNINPDFIISVPQLINAASSFRKFGGGTLTMLEFFDFWGDKAMALLMFCREELFIKTAFDQIVLLDDAVIDSTFQFENINGKSRRIIFQRA